MPSDLFLAKLGSSASWALQPRMPGSSGLRFGMKSGATLAPPLPVDKLLTNYRLARPLPPETPCVFVAVS